MPLNLVIRLQAAFPSNSLQDANFFRAWVTASIIFSRRAGRAGYGRDGIVALAVENPNGVKAMVLFPAATSLQEVRGRCEHADGTGTTER